MSAHARCPGRTWVAFGSRCQQRQSRRLCRLFRKTPREEPRAKTFPFLPAGLAALAKSPAARVSQPVRPQLLALRGNAGKAGKAVGPWPVELGGERHRKRAPEARPHRRRPLPLTPIAEPSALPPHACARGRDGRAGLAHGAGHPVLSVLCFSAVADEGASVVSALRTLRGHVPI